MVHRYLKVNFRHLLIAPNEYICVFDQEMFLLLPDFGHHLGLDSYRCTQRLSTPKAPQPLIASSIVFHMPQPLFQWARATREEELPLVQEFLSSNFLLSNFQLLHITFTHKQLLLTSLSINYIRKEFYLQRFSWGDSLQTVQGCAPKDCVIWWMSLNYKKINPSWL